MGKSEASTRPSSRHPSPRGRKKAKVDESHSRAPAAKRKRAEPEDEDDSRKPVNVAPFKRMREKGQPVSLDFELIWQSVQYF